MNIDQWKLSKLKNEEKKNQGSQTNIDLREFNKELHETNRESMINIDVNRRKESIPPQEPIDSNLNIEDLLILKGQK